MYPQNGGALIGTMVPVVALAAENVPAGNEPTMNCFDVDLEYVDSEVYHVASTRKLLCKIAYSRVCWHAGLLREYRPDRTDSFIVAGCAPVTG